MRNIKLKLGYVGKNYFGFVKQPGLLTVEGILEETIFKLTAERPKIFVASRTDRGVHAVGQVVNFFTTSLIKGGNFKKAINNFLPPDIRIFSSEEVDLNFNARYLAKWREYIYNIYIGRKVPLSGMNFFWAIYHPLDFTLMQEGTRFFRGEKDFFIFSDGEQGNTVRIIDKLDFEFKRFEDYIGEANNSSENQEEGRVLQVKISANGFLMHMARNIVGTLVDLGRGKISLAEVEKMFFIKDRSLRRINAAVPWGLCLKEVGYE